MKVKTKVCSICRKRKSIKNFFLRTNPSKTADCRCKSCKIKLKLDWQKTKSGREARQRAYRRDLLRNPGRALELNRKWRKEHPNQARNHELKRNFHITLKEWKEIFKDQGKKCAICKSAKPNTKNQWFTDHDPSVKVRSKEPILIRGILCGKCNAALGFANDSIDILKNAIEYLSKFKSEED